MPRRTIASSAVLAVLVMATVATPATADPPGHTANPASGHTPADLSYSYRYPLHLPSSESPQSVASSVAADLPGYFPFDSDCDILPPVGSRCELYSIPGFPLWGTTNPVLVVNRTDTSWTFRSLPGHIEGAGRYITFSLHDDLPGLSLHTDSWGPSTLPATLTVGSGTARAIWQLFATNITAKLG